MKNRKIVIISGMIALGLGASAVGTTFALFTDRADTQIEVQAGIVEVSSAIDGLLTYSVAANENGDRVDENNHKYISKLTEVAGVFTNGGTATIDSTLTTSQITLDRITPGDRVVFDVDLSSESNVNYKYRIFFRAVGDDMSLVKGMSTSITINGSKNSYLGLYKYESPWTLATPGQALPALNFDIELPVNKDNIYQNTHASYLLGIEAVQANAKLPEGSTLSTIYDDAVESTLVGDHDTVIEASNRDESVKVRTTIPATAQEIENGDIVKLVVSDLIVEENDKSEVGKLTFDASLYVNGNKKTSFSKPIKVQVYLDKYLEITELTHNGETISDFTYDRTTGLIEFYTDSFSPFEVSYKKLATKNLTITSNYPNRGSVDVLASTGLKDEEGHDILKKSEENKVIIGEMTTLQAVPNYGYVFAGFKINGATITENPYQVMADDNLDNIEVIFDYDQYDLSFTTEDTTKGTVLASAAPYYYDHEVTLEADANQGYSFDGWYDVNGNKVSSENPFNFTVQGPENNYQARFSTNSYEMEVINSNPTLGTVEGEGVYLYGSDVTLVATPNPGIKFDGWYIGGNCVSVEKEYSFTMPYEDTTVQASFSYIDYSVTIGLNSEEGVVTGQGTTYHYGDEVTVTATPNQGYSFDGWYDQDSNKVSSNTTYSFTVYGNNSFQAKFTANKYLLTVGKQNNSGNVAISTSGISSGTNVAYKTQVTVVATPVTGARFDGWYKGNDKVSSNATYTFTMPYEDLALVARFSLVNYTLTVNSESTNKGTVSGGGTFHYNDNVTITATPKTGYGFDGWYLSNNKVSSSASYSFKMPANNATYVAKFKANTYTVTATSESTTKGTVTGGGNYAYGSSVTLKATAKSGYAFAGWYQGTTRKSSNASWTFTMGAGNVSYQAKFEVAADTSLFNYKDDGKGGYTIIGVKKEKYVEGMDLLLPSKYNGKNCTSIGCVMNGNTYSSSADDVANYDFCIHNSSVATIDTPVSLRFGTITLNSNITEIQDYAFRGHSLTNNAFRVKNIVGLENITKIGRFALHNINSTTALNLNLPNLTTIGDYSCANIDNVQNLYVNKLTNLGNGWDTEHHFGAFYGLLGSSFNKITIGASCTFSEETFAGEKARYLGYDGSFSEVSAKEIHIKCTSFSLLCTFAQSTSSNANYKGKTCNLKHIYFYNGISFTRSSHSLSYFFRGQSGITLHIGQNVTYPTDLGTCSTVSSVTSENLPK